MVLRALCASAATTRMRSYPYGYPGRISGDPAGKVGRVFYWPEPSSRFPSHILLPSREVGTMSFRVTESWIMEFRTSKGAWTRKQLEAIGVAWPPRQGWKLRVEGSEITEDQRQQFESRSIHNQTNQGRLF